MLDPGAAVSPPVDRPRSDFTVRSVAQIDWPHWDVRLVAANPTDQTAVLWMAGPGALSIRALDYESGREAERWDTTPDRMPHAGRFRSLTGDLEADVARYARLLRGAEGRWLTPGFMIVPGGEHVLYGVAPTRNRDGDAWLVANPDGQPRFRLAPTLSTATRTALSPDGTKVATGGCCHTTEPGGNPYHLYLAELDGKAKRVVEVPHPGRPIFDPEGETVYAASRHFPDRICVHRVPFSNPGARVELRCLASSGDEPFLFLVDPPNADGERLLLVANPRGELRDDYDLVLLRPSDGELVSTIETQDTQLEPHLVDGHRLLLSSRVLTLVDLHTGALAELDEATFEGFPSYPTVVRPDHGEPFALALRGQRGRADVHELVRITLPGAR